MEKDRQAPRRRGKQGEMSKECGHMSTLSAPRRRGKQAERDIARRLGGKRSTLLGVKAPDVEGSWFIAEVKNYLKAPEIPYRNLQNLRRTYGTERLNLFVYKRPDWRDYVVCCLLSEFEEWNGQLIVSPDFKLGGEE